MIKLRNEQIRFIEYGLMKSKEQQYTICEMPTAFGKSICALVLAKKIIEEKNYDRVVIATSNNILARDIYNEALNVAYMPSYVLGIGKDNYVDLAAVQALKHDKDYIKDSETFDIKIKNLVKTYGEVLIDDFLDEFDITDEDEKAFIKETYCLQDSNRDNFKNYDIQITNYAYLFSSFMADDYKKVNSIDDENEKPEKVFYIFDEIQEIPNIAELILSKGFSIYSYKIQLRNIEKKIALTGKNKTLLKDIRKEIDKINVVESIFINEKLAGKTVKNEKEAKLKADKIYGVLFKDDIFFTKLAKYNEKDFSYEINNFLKYAKEGKATLQTNDIYLSYSSKKGFILFKAYSGNVGTYLTYKFWTKIDSFIGVTATALLSKDPQDLRAYIRIGINIKDYVNDRGEITCKGHLEKVNAIQIFDGILKPSQAKYYITKHEYIDNEKARLDFIANEVYEKFNNKNTMVLLGGFDEVDSIRDRLEKKGITPICARPGISTKHTIEEFKAKGGILLATRNYNTGVNLKGKELENIFISKIPYPVAQTKKWLETKRKCPNTWWLQYENDMIINFRQAIGRLIRTPKDKGNIYILDTKFNKEDNKGALRESIVKKLIYFLEKVSENGDNKRGILNKILRK